MEYNPLRLNSTIIILVNLTLLVFFSVSCREGNVDDLKNTNKTSDLGTSEIPVNENHEGIQDFKTIINFLDTLGYKLIIEKNNSISDVNPLEHPIYKNIELFSSLFDINKVQAIKKAGIITSKPIIIKNVRYYPQFNIEQWIFADTVDAINCFLVMSRNEILLSPQNDKSPQRLLCYKNQILHITATAELYKEYLDELSNDLNTYFQRQ